MVGWMVAFALVACEGGGGDFEGDDTVAPGEDVPASTDTEKQVDLGVAQQELAAAAFGPFVPVPTGLTNEGPAVTSRGSNIDAYVRGLDNQLYYNYWSQLTGWLGWSPQGGILTSKPSATSIAYNTGLAVVARGLDSFFWIRVSLPPSGGGHPVSTAWLRIPGRQFVQAPAVAFLTDTILVFGISNNNAMYVSRNRLTQSGGTWTYNHASWTPWQGLGGIFYSEPAATVTSSGRLYVAGRGTDRRFWFAWSFNGVNYNGAWTAAPGGVYSSGPALVARQGEVNMFGRGLDGAYWISTSFGGNFGTLGRINGGPFDSSPGATIANGRVYVFGTTLDERIRYARAN